ncbi:MULTISPECIES: D-amino acid dehydrogenase [unclassified Pseudomonas]|uniref:D-amino acid dehydrogenase n=1 Tax=unclassified Pseudomonas TaxID=196821 RepID=UPI000D3A893B|nr:MULTISPECIES: D-amino acid dehydrogenase [unclassified Pseudomonas]RAU44054.1 FAD-dependent oxidoreductase [Pseudomonas sp. RIT 409]RAU54799.1 FAD-dependent oxidoreductase [Pseudomonas sp. RIT 412]
MQVVVIGAGVVGLTSAWYLAQKGLNVTLVDRHTDVAQETSFANGGQLSYSYVAPLADPGVIAKLPQWLLRADSPLRFRPRLDPLQWRWCLHFLRACNDAQVRRTIGEMLSLSYFSRDALDELLAAHPLDFDLIRTGKLVVYRDAAALAAAVPLVDWQRGLGADQRVLDGPACVDLEPSLQSVAGQLAGGIYTPGEATGDCYRFCQALKRLLTQLPNVTLALGREVRALVGERQRVVAVRTDQGDLPADAVVVAAGMFSVPLLKPLGIRLPLYGLRGYSLSVPLDTAIQVPHLSITDAARKIVYAPLGGQLRIAAMVDMGVSRADVDPARISLLKQQVAETFPDLDLGRAQAWAGLRPSTAHSKPLIGRAQGMGNLWLNVGQGALGFTLALGSAKLLAAQMTGASSPIDHGPFQPR